VVGVVVVIEQRIEWSMSNLFVGGGEFKSKATETYGGEVAFSDLKTAVPFDSEVTMMCEYELLNKGR
jgi:hypothetical protein